MSTESECTHPVLDEMVGVSEGYEVCVTCSRKFSIRDDVVFPVREEPDQW